jgi:hypothetical protein
MRYTKVKSYTDKTLLDRVKSLSNFKAIPQDYWILGVRSHADSGNIYDDKFYLFKGEHFIMVTTGTTNPGTDALVKGWQKVNKDGAFILKSDYWHYNLWRPGKHNGKIKALVQTGNVAVGYRDNNNNDKSEEVGLQRSGWYGINFHCNSYNKLQGIISWFIGGWSYGCQVCNNPTDYYHILDLIGKQSKVSYCLVLEF